MSRAGVPQPFCIGGFVVHFITGGSMGVLSVPLRICVRGLVSMLTAAPTLTWGVGTVLLAGLP